MNVESEKKLMRRVAGYHDLRLDGMMDLVIRARDQIVMDIGCNRGLVGFEFANNGAKVIHGCDNFAEGIETARQLFADLRNVESQFECVDLSKGPNSLRPFGTRSYDITVMLATYHKLKRIMHEDGLTELMRHFADHTGKYFAWRGTSDKPQENEAEMRALDRDLKGLKRVHTSKISHTLGLAAIWERF